MSHNALIYLNQSVPPYGVSLNSIADHSTSFPLSKFFVEHNRNFYKMVLQFPQSRRVMLRSVWTLHKWHLLTMTNWSYPSKEANCMC